MKKRLFSVMLVCLFCFPVTYAQHSKLDSLLTLLKADKEDTLKVKHLNAISRSYRRNGNPGKGMEFAQAALQLAGHMGPGTVHGWPKGLAQAYNNIGAAYEGLGQFGKALEAYSLSLKAGQGAGDKLGVAVTYNNIGIIYFNQGDYDKALENYFSALKLREECGDKKGIAQSSNNIANVYAEQGHYDKALQNLQVSLKMKEELGDPYDIASALNNIGALYERKGDYDKALENLIASKKIEEKIGNKGGLAESYNNIGLIYYLQDRLDLAKENFVASMSILEETGDQQGLAKAYNNMGNLYLKQKKLTEAKQQELISLDIAKKIGSKEDCKQAYQTLSLCDSAAANWKGAYEYHKLYMEANDSIFSAESAKKSAEMNARYESEKQETQIKLLEKDREKQSAITLTENKRHKTILIAVITGLSLMILFSVFMYNRWRVTQRQKTIIEKQKKKVDEQKELVEEKNKDIIDSINYAKRIQDALLKEEEHVSAHLPEHFIFFKPKDIVSGDFYWALEQKNYFYIAAVDCTGHGVPGAFMSMLGIAFLNEITANTQKLSPAEILNQLRDKIIRELGQTGKAGGSKDGMDISIACLNLETNEMQWAGANNPLYLIRGGLLTQIKPNKQPIGFQENQQPFSNHSFQLESGTSFYLFTDGYADQFGGEKGKKFKYSQLQELLVSIHKEPMPKQKDVLKERFADWKGHMEQVDDVCLIGMRIG